MRRTTIFAVLALGLVAFPAAAMADRGIGGGGGGTMPHKDDLPTLRHFAEPWDGWQRGKPFWNKRFDAYARLAPTDGGSVHGQVFLRQREGSLVVRLNVAGLAPGSRHSIHIHQGGCAPAANGPIVLPFPDLIANAGGRAKLYVTLPTEPGKDYAAAGFYVNLHAGFGDAAGGGISCGDVRDRGQKGSARVRSYAGAGDTHGRVEVKQRAGATHVWVNLRGLMPGSTHAQRVFVGSCGALGAVALELPTATADARGRVLAHYELTTGGDLFSTATAYAIHGGDATTPAAACGELRGQRRGGPWWWNWHA